MLLVKPRQLKVTYLKGCLIIHDVVSSDNTTAKQLRQGDILLKIKKLSLAKSPHIKSFRRAQSLFAL
jgi:hypothetical protein